MLIEPIIEFELRGPGPPGRTFTPITVYFHDKTKIFQENFQVDYYLLLKQYRRQCVLFPPTSKSLTKFSTKMQDLNRVLDINCKQKEN